MSVYRGSGYRGSMEKHIQDPSVKKSAKKRGKGPQKKGPTTKVLAKRIKALEDQEEAKHDDAFFSSTIDDSGFILTPMQTAQQTSDITRVGNEVIAKNGEVGTYLATVAGTHITRVRMIIFWDLQSNGADPTIYTSTSTTTGLLDNSVITSKLQAPYNSNCSERYKILKDKVYVLSGNSSTVQAGVQDLVKLSYHNARIKYGDGNLINNLVGRNLVIYYVSNQTAASGLAPAVVFTHRWFYTDP